MTISGANGSTVQPVQDDATALDLARLGALIVAHDEPPMDVERTL